MYKIITLGESFVFCVDKGIKKEFKYELNEGHVIQLGNSLECDYEVYTKRIDFFMPDFHRALMSYLYKVRAYPSSEYDIKFYDTKQKISVPEFNGKFGGNVGKCKLLFSNYDNNREDLCFIEIENRKYLVLKTDNISSFDDKKFVCRSYTESDDFIDANALIVYCKKGSDVVFRYSEILKNNSSISSSAYAALAYLVYLVENNSCTNVLYQGYSARCEVSCDEVFVFDNNPKIYKLV